ncbi:MAG: hypothetical protein AAB492_00880 [Patescibacteria group bacterium]
MTLSRASLVQTVQRSFQYIGYYNRPLSSFLYIAILTLFFLLYVTVLARVKKGIFDRSFVWKVIFILVVTLVISYPAAFSYDFFNYMFTAKTVLLYHKNPYMVTPLMFAGVDPWLNFMRWTHLSSAYAPLWILLSLVPYVLGFGYFILIMINMKALIALFYLLSCLMIEKILKKERAADATYGLAMFALNPLIIVETLVSSHNDIVLVAFMLVSFWYLSHKDMIASWFWLSMSIAAKLMTLTLVPLYAIKPDKVLMFLAMMVGLTVAVIKREFLPWYLVWVLPFVALDPNRKGVYSAFSILSVGLLLSYVPYLYTGSYTTQSQYLKTSIIFIAVVGSLVAFFASQVRFKK